MAKARSCGRKTISFRPKRGPNKGKLVRFVGNTCGATASTKSSRKSQGRVLHKAFTPMTSRKGNKFVGVRPNCSYIERAVNAGNLDESVYERHCE